MPSLTKKHYSPVQKLREAELSYLWSKMSCNPPPGESLFLCQTTDFESAQDNLVVFIVLDLVELLDPRGMRSIIILRDLFLNFVIIVRELVEPHIVDIELSYWSEKFEDWSEDFNDYEDGLPEFKFCKILDREVKRENLRSIIRKKGVHDLDDFMAMFKFAEKWRNVSFFQAHPSPSYSIAEGVISDISSTHSTKAELGKLSSFLQVENNLHENSNETSSTQRVSLKLMLCNSRKIAAYLSMCTDEP